MMWVEEKPLLTQIAVLKYQNNIFKRVDLDVKTNTFLNGMDNSIQSLCCIHTNTKYAY